MINLRHQVSWCVCLVLLRYFHLATFFWMFVEGKYISALSNQIVLMSISKYDFFLMRILLICENVHNLVSSSFPS